MATQGPVLPTIAAAGTGWSSPNAITLDNGTTAQVNGPGAFPGTDDIWGTQFNFSIPLAATLLGITVQLRKAGTNATSTKHVVDDTVKLRLAGSQIGLNKADTITFWPVAFNLVSYGGATDVWSAGLTPSDINSATFGVYVMPNNTSSGLAGARLQAIYVTITYTASNTTLLSAQTAMYTVTDAATTRHRTVTRTADPPLYGLTDEPSTPTKTLHLIPSGPTLYTSTPAPTLRAHTRTRTANTAEYTTSPAPTTRLITRNLSADPASYSTTPRSTTRQKTSNRSAQLCKYQFTARPTAPNVWRKGVRRTLPRPDADNWRSLLLFTGLSVTGDIGPITTYTTAAGKKVWFMKYELDGKIRTPARVACRDRWRAAATEWQKLTPTEKTNWEAVTKKLSLRLTGYNLWMWWATHQDDESINTVARQAEIPLLPPSTRH